jgi:hypothetical protein
MPKYDHLCRLAATAVVSGLLLCPSSGYAATGIQFFPPQLPSPAPADTVCPPSPPGYTYAEVWDGVHNVECAKIPTTCTAGQGLQFNGSNFVCVTPCSIPVVTQQNVQPCPAGQQGSIYEQVTTQCDGSSALVHQNTCDTLLSFPAVSAVQCTVGGAVFGYYESSGRFNVQCNAATPCSLYVCTVGGLVPE